MRCLGPFLMVAGLLAVHTACSQPVIDPVADLFAPRPPLPVGVGEQPVGPLRLPDAATSGGGASGAPIPLFPAARSPTVRRPPFNLKSGERLLLLGDAIFEEEAKHGYLETRLQIQYPATNFIVRNLSSSPHNRLRERAPAVAEQDSLWLTNLLDEVRAVRPNVVFLSYGTGPAMKGAETLSSFSNVYSRVLDGLLRLDTNAPPRLVVLSPLSNEPVAGETLTDVTNRNQVVVNFADTAWRISTNKGAELVDLYLFTRNDVVTAVRRLEQGGKPIPRLTQDGMRPTTYGLRRLGFALERGLRWSPTTWRFSLMSDGKWREGGFGAVIHSHQRTDQYARVTFTEERLPMPNPPEELDLIAEAKPHCFIQLRGLKDGEYDLRVDGQRTLDGTHLEWNRYEIITQGPSWDQAEQLRQSIVRKNAVWEKAWEAQRANGSRAATEADSQVLALESQIAKLKQPVQRIYEIVRTGDVPPGKIGQVFP